MPPTGSTPRHATRSAGPAVAAQGVPALLVGPLLGAVLDRTRHRRALFAGAALPAAAACSASCSLTPEALRNEALVTGASIEVGAAALGASLAGAVVTAGGARAGTLLLAAGTALGAVVGIAALRGPRRPPVPASRAL